MPSQYSKDGVNVEEESKFSSFAGKICKGSYQNSPFVEVHDFSGGHFRGPRPFTFKNLPEGYFIEATTDGMGTKGVLVDAAKTHEQAAYDIVAMTSSDVTRFGGIPLVFINVLDVVAVGNEGDEVSNQYKKLLSGLGKVSGEAKIVSLKGETAQMGVFVGSDWQESKTRFNWSATMIGAYHKDKMITGESLRDGQVIIALKEQGFRCNGISAVRAALKDKFGERWYENKDAQKSIKLAAAPSLLYDVFINTIHGWYDKNFQAEVKIHGLVHLSGGGIKEKLAKDMLLPRSLSAELTDLYDPPQIMKDCAAWHNIDDEEFYEVWNGGQGMLLIVKEKDAETTIKRANDFDLQAKICGKITKAAKPQVVIDSKLNPGKKIIYE